MKHLILASLLLFASLPANAVEFKNPACPTLEEVEQPLTEQGEKFVVLDSLDLLGVTVQEGGKIIVATFGGYMAFGYVTDGCVTPPTPIGHIVPAKGA